MDTSLGTLSLDQNNTDAKTLAADWQDGQEYDITLHVKQTAPFSFDVVSAEETETPEETAAPTEETDTEAPMGARHQGMPKGVAILIAGAGKSGK
jgi:hypothetical protein